MKWGRTWPNLTSLSGTDSCSVGAQRLIIQARTSSYRFLVKILNSKGFMHLNLNSKGFLF